MTALLDLALIGSRARGFHHDIASKLQMLMCSLDELTERAEASGDRDLARVVEAATEAMRGIHGELNTYRALARDGGRAAVPLGELLAAGGARTRTRITGELPVVAVTCGRARALQALALACEELGAAGGVVRATATVDGATVSVALVREGTISGEKPPPDSLDLIAHALARDGGTAARDGDGLVLVFKT